MRGSGRYKERAIAGKGVYQEKFGFGCGPVIATLFTLACVAAWVFWRDDLPGDEPVRGYYELPVLIEVCLIVGAALGSWGIVRLLVVIAKGRVALRVDEQGIRMTRLAFRDRTASRRTTVTPWSSIDLLVVDHEATAPGGSDTFLRLCRYVDGTEVNVERLAVAGWSLDRDKLVAAARRWSPGIAFDERHPAN